MPRSAAAFLVLLTLCAPLALADQDHALGPASVTTLNAESGDGCAAGGNGSASRHAEVRVDATEHESLVVLFSQSCSSWNQTFDDGNGGEAYARGTHDSGVVMVARSSDENVGPNAQAGYHDMRQDSTWGAGRNCWSYAYAAGPAVSPGCWPADAGRAPMAPTLP